MGGGGGSSTSFLARSTTLQSFPLPLNPPPPSPSPHLNPLERSSLPTSVPLPTQTCFRIILELENAGGPLLGGFAGSASRNAALAYGRVVDEGYHGSEGGECEPATVNDR